MVCGAVPAVGVTHRQQGMVSINNHINRIKHIAADFHEARTREPTYSMTSPLPSAYS
jgi:hypothetical protein